VLHFHSFPFRLGVDLHCVSPHALRFLRSGLAVWWLTRVVEGIACDSRCVWALFAPFWCIHVSFVPFSDGETLLGPSIHGQWTCWLVLGLDDLFPSPPQSHGAHAMDLGFLGHTGVSFMCPMGISSLYGLALTAIV
jgi:hypothetical protein